MLNSFNFAIEHGVFHRDQKTSLISLLLNPFTREFKIFYLSPQREFFQATVILDCLALLFPWRRVMLVM